MPTTFTLTSDHLKLLALLAPRRDLSETEVGAPEFDGKRPYGNSDHLVDIVEALHGREAVEDDEGYVSTDNIDPEMLEEARRLHGEIATAFAVVWSAVVAGVLDRIEPGTYQATGLRWTRA